MLICTEKINKFERFIQIWQLKTKKQTFCYPTYRKSGEKTHFNIFIYGSEKNTRFRCVIRFGKSTTFFTIVVWSNIRAKVAEPARSYCLTKRDDRRFLHEKSWMSIVSSSLEGSAALRPLDLRLKRYKIILVISKNKQSLSLSHLGV